jgi:hypothetical protein
MLLHYVQQPEQGQQRPAQTSDRNLLERYTSIDLFGLDLKNVVRGHQLTDHMLFNDDDKYKALMNEVLQCFTALPRRRLPAMLIIPINWNDDDVSLLLHFPGFGLQAAAAFQVGGHRSILVLSACSNVSLTVILLLTLSSQEKWST